MNNRTGSRRPWRRGLGFALVLVGALFLPSCESNSPTIPGGVARAVIQVAVVPNPVIGVQNTLTGSVSAAYVINVRELAGLGGKIQFVNSTVFDPENGLQAAVNYFDSADLLVFVGSDRVEGGGELDITQTTNYTLQDFRVNAELSVAVQVLDDRGNLVNQSILVPIIRSPAE